MLILLRCQPVKALVRATTHDDGKPQIRSGRIAGSLMVQLIFVATGHRLPLPVLRKRVGVTVCPSRRNKEPSPLTFPEYSLVITHIATMKVVAPEERQNVAPGERKPGVWTRSESQPRRGDRRRSRRGRCRREALLSPLRGWQLFSGAVSPGLRPGLHSVGPPGLQFPVGIWVMTSVVPGEGVRFSPARTDRHALRRQTIGVGRAVASCSPL